MSEDDENTTDLYELEPGMGTSSLDQEAKRTMRVVEGKFGQKKKEEDQEITTAEFLAAFAAKNKRGLSAIFSPTFPVQEPKKHMRFSF